MNEKNSIFIKPLLKEIFWNGWEEHQIIFFSAPCGYGKTTTAKALLSKHEVCQLDVIKADFLSEEIPKKCNIVLIDDLQFLLEAKRQKDLCNLILSRLDLHFILLGRGYLPGCLMPFQFAGTMLLIEEDDLNFDRDTALKMLESKGIKVSKNEIGRIMRHTGGYPLAMDIICRNMKDGRKYSKEILNKGTCDLFFYFEEEIFLRLEAPIRFFLLDLAPFKSFSLELAEIVSGNSRAGEILGIIHRETKMLEFDGIGTYKFHPFFQKFLMWQLEQKFTDTEKRMLYSRAGLYYELREDFEHALKFYSLAKEQNKVSELLIKNAEKNPGVGYYREMKNYYFDLPREEILKSPSLISAMSMLTAICMDYQASENWYKDLQNYLVKLKKSDYEYRIVQGKLANLDIALPQRVSESLVKIISSIFKLVVDKDLKVPSLSVTSTLPSIMNGGKDFCEWSKKDDFLYASMRKPLETLLGPDGVGLADCGICESKFEKGEDISNELLTLMSRLGEIQVRGTPDIEFAVIGLLARVQISHGKAGAALKSLQCLRDKFSDTGNSRFMGNIDAMICRIHIQLGDRESAQIWFEEKAPKNDVELWILWRYQYITRVMVEIWEGEYEDALILLARMMPYCTACNRVMDTIYINLLTSICKEHLGDKNWKDEINIALDLSYEYNFIWPVAQYGVEILHLLKKSKWKKDPGYLEEIISATRIQANFYPKFLKVQLQSIETLSKTEVQVLKLLCENLTNQEIGEILGVKLATVKSHVSHILHKLGVSRRSEAKDLAEELGLFSK